MNQDDCRIQRLKSEEAKVTTKILSLETTDEFQKLVSKELLEFLSQEPNSEAIRRIIEIAHKQFELLRFDEFKNKELADWKRIRTAIEHENTLVNHRLTWLLTSQGFLFTGFGVVYSTKQTVNLYSTTILLVIAIVGMAISFKIFMDIEGASEQLSELDKWWHMTYAPEEYERLIHRDEITTRRKAYNRKLKKRHPALQRLRERKMFWLDKGLKVEISFLIAWVAIISGVIGKPLVKLLYETKHDYSDGWYGMPLFLALACIIGWWIRYHRPPNNPLLGSRPGTMTARESTLNVLIDSKGNRWAKLDELLGIYELPPICDSERKHIYSGFRTFELTLQQASGPVILDSIIHENNYYCQVLEFADDVGISTTFNPLQLHERAGVHSEDSTELV